MTAIMTNMYCTLPGRHFCLPSRRAGAESRMVQHNRYMEISI